MFVLGLRTLCELSKWCEDLTHTRFYDRVDVPNSVVYLNLDTYIWAVYG